MINDDYDYYDIDTYDLYDDYDEIETMQFDDENEFQPPGRRRGLYPPRVGIPPRNEFPEFPSNQPGNFPPFGNLPPGSQIGNAPIGAPPNRIPVRTRRSPGLYAVDPGSIYNCKYKFSYIWLENGRAFWAWLTFVGRRSVAGYRWMGYGWVYFGTDLDNISDFVCF